MRSLKPCQIPTQYHVDKHFSEKQIKRLCRWSNQAASQKIQIVSISSRLIYASSRTFNIGKYWSISWAFINHSHNHSRWPTAADVHTVIENSLKRRRASSSKSSPWQAKKWMVARSRVNNPLFFSRFTYPVSHTTSWRHSCYSDKRLPDRDSSSLRSIELDVIFHQSFS